jgi:hypothetical protein
MSSMFQASTGTKTLFDFGHASCITIKFVLENKSMCGVMIIFFLIHEAIETQSIVITARAHDIGNHVG